MNLAEARDECSRWLHYWEHRKVEAASMAQIAADRRAGKCTLEEAKALVRAIDVRKGLTVYDGGRLVEAVKFLMEHTK